MVIGTVYVVFSAQNFATQFQGFLITLGVPIAGWCGVMLADILQRKRDYAEADLFDPHRPLRRRPHRAARRAHRRHVPRLGPGHEHPTPAG